MASSTGVHYSDVESGESREIDIIATLGGPADKAAVHFTFECKASKSPWVLFTSDDRVTHIYWTRAYGVWSRAAWAAFVDQAGGSVPESAQEAEQLAGAAGPYVSWTGPNGYALAQACQGNSDAPYAAVLSALKAARSCLNAAPHVAEVPGLTVAHPVVVIQGPLVECKLDSSGEVVVETIKRGCLYFQQRIADIMPQYVSIITFDGLDEFIAEATRAADKTHDLFWPAVHDEIERERGAR